MVRAATDQGYAVVSGVTRIPEWSPQTTRAEWLAPNRFQAWNRRPGPPVTTCNSPESKYSDAGRPLVREGTPSPLQDRVRLSRPASELTLPCPYYLL